ncbi:type II secretion system F family protein [Phenylobacterium sp.]|uniref:type II secretion system F family protein n=1 Tax=Phenylobacterium sp. TaxID=1871053 RepID=UPI0035AD9444
MSLPLLLCLALLLTSVGVLGARLHAERRPLMLRARRLAAAGGRPTPASVVRRSGGSPLDRLARQLLPSPEVLQARLRATGRPLRLGSFLAVNVALAVAVAALGLALGTPLGLALLSGLANGLLLPHLAVGAMIGQRRRRFLALFPEAIGLIVRGLRSGLPITEAVSIVGAEIADPVGQEFRSVSDQMRLGVRLEDGMWQAARRLDLAEFNFLVIALSVQRETGGNLAETLENLEQILRRRQQMALKIRAMSSEATASALIIGALPFFMAALMWVVSRDYLTVLFTDPRGQLMLAGGVGSLAAGAMIMRQMVRFEI